MSHTPQPEVESILLPIWMDMYLKTDETPFRIGAKYPERQIIMLFDLQVTDGGNSPMELHRVFDLLNDAQPIGRVFTADFQGQDRWCDVTGWDESGPCQAYAVLSEDSGEGVVLLIYGGYHGIRLKTHDCIEEWDLASQNQWGEACLLLDKDAPYEKRDES